MKKILYSSVGSAFALALATTPAVADVNVLATLFKTKVILVDVEILKDKTVLLSADVDVLPTSAAEALAIANVTNTFNSVGQSLQEGIPLHADYDIYRRAAIDTSVNTNAGVVELNQDVGNMANQGNVLAFAVVFSLGGDIPNTTYVDAEAWVDQVNSDNHVTHLENGEDATPGGEPDFAPGNPNAADGNANVVATIGSSISGNSGIVGVNQNAGNMNNQTNVVALAVGFGTVAALSEGALGQENTRNTVHESGVKKLASIGNSINGNTGVVHVNQAAGSNGNQANVFALAFTQGGP